jgi:hypothetical protein
MITLAHFRVSSVMSFLKLAREPPIVVPPKVAQALFTASAGKVGGAAIRAKCYLCIGIYRFSDR